MSVPEVIQGVAVNDWKLPKKVEYAPKKVLPTDVMIKINYCGVCGSDVHTANGNWGPHKRNDLVVGHEIVGSVIKVGEKVSEVKVGDTVGVGAHSNSCHECKLCKSDNEQYCPKQIPTYNGVDYYSDDYVTQGGYASHAVADIDHVFPIPKDLPEEFAGPLMCAGLTVFSPLYRSLHGKGDGKLVGVIGIGGLGHLAVMFAKALGAKVVAFSRSSKKKEETLKLGADEFIATGEEPEWNQKYFKEFDVVLNCASSFTDVHFETYLPAIAIDGQFVTVGAPAASEMMNMHAFQFILNNATLKGSEIGSKKEATIMLKLAAEKKIYPIIEKKPINEANVGEVLERVENSDVRYRFVLTDFDKYFG